MASGFFNPYMKWTINKPCLKPPTSNGKRLHNELENRPMLFMRKKKKHYFDWAILSVRCLWSLTRPGIPINMAIFSSHRDLKGWSNLVVTFYGTAMVSRPGWLLIFMVNIN